MAKPYSFRPKHTIEGPWIVEGPNGFSLELVDRLDAGLMAKMLNALSEAEASLLAKKLTAMSMKQQHATKKPKIGPATYTSVVSPDDVEWTKPIGHQPTPQEIKQDVDWILAKAARRK
jgi:hypothetical protein